MHTVPDPRRVTRREAAALIATVPLVAAGVREPKADIEALRSAALFAMDLG